MARGPGQRMGRDLFQKGFLFGQRVQGHTGLPGGVSCLLWAPLNRTWRPSLKAFLSRMDVDACFWRRWGQLRARRGGLAFLELASWWGAGYRP